MLQTPSRDPAPPTAGPGWWCLQGWLEASLRGPREAQPAPWEPVRAEESRVWFIFPPALIHKLTGVDESSDCDLLHL